MKRFLCGTITFSALLLPCLAIAAEWTETCDRVDLTQSSTVCLVDSWSTIWWDKQTAAKQAEAAARSKRWGYRKAKLYCIRTNGPKSVVGDGSYEQEILERIKGEVYVGVRINPQCTQPASNSLSKKTVKESGDGQPEATLVQDLLRLIREANEKDHRAQVEKILDLQNNCASDTNSPSCAELKELYNQKVNNSQGVRG